MKRIGYLTLAVVMAVGLLASLAIADEYTCPGYTPSPNTVVFNPYIYHDCPYSNYATINNYPALVQISDGDEGCAGWTNLHTWRFSEDGVTRAAFENCSHYRFSAVLKFSNPTGEFGLQIAPWWGGAEYSDGRFNVRADEIACFGGRLPFYSFTAAYGLTYTAGEPIWLQITYDPNELDETEIVGGVRDPAPPNPASIQYQVYYRGQGYSSPVLYFDKANPAEPHGIWGELYPAYVGGFVQAPNNASSSWAYTCNWENIHFEGPSATPAKSSTWGQLKTLYR